MLRFLVRSLGFGILSLVQPLVAPDAAAMDAPVSYTLTCQDIVVDADPFGLCNVVVNYPEPVLSPSVENAQFSCDPPSGSVFTLGPVDPDGVNATPVTCTARDPEGNILATCTFTVTLRDGKPSCEFWYTDPRTGTRLTDLVLVAENGQVTLRGLDFTIGRSACSQSTHRIVRSDGFPFFAVLGPTELTPFPVGQHVITVVMENALGIISECSINLTVLSPSVGLANQLFVRYRVPLPGETQFIDLDGLAELKVQVRYPGTPGEPTRLHAHLNLHKVTATWNGVEYHATNNANAHLTSDQIASVPLNLPGRYEFVARGKAAVRSFKLDLPLLGTIDAGVLSAGFGEPQFVK